MREQENRENGRNLCLRTGFESEDECNGVFPREKHRKGSGSMWVLLCAGTCLACALLP